MDDQQVARRVRTMDGPNHKKAGEPFGRPTGRPQGEDHGWSESITENNKRKKRGGDYRPFFYLTVQTYSGLFK